MEYINSKRENISNFKKIYLNDIDNSSTDFTEKMNDSNKIPQEKKIGNYCLDKIIFKGSTSKVFLAKHIITGEKVAIKILNKKLFKSDILSLKRIKKEIQILKMVKHENIIRLLEIIENNNNIYLVTDYYQNDLISLVIKNKKLSEEKSLYYFSQYVNGLHYLYQSGICHRNIRPENLLLDEKNEKLKIIDFGLSTTYKKNELLNSIVGAIIYAPPEMHLSEKYSGELVDIWNAGIVLYFMVCGKLPFCDEDEEKNIKHIITGFYEIPSFVSKYCAEIIKSCLQVDPKKRINFSQLSKYINYSKGLIFEINLIPFDEKVLEECKKFLRDINNQEIIEKIRNSVKNNKFDEFNALYYLVMKKMERKGYDSISDLSSDKFKDYITNSDPLSESVYKQKKAPNYIHIKSNVNIKNLGNNNNSMSMTNKSLSNLNKNQLIYSPLIIKNYSSKKNTIQRNLETKSKFMKSYLNDINISYKNSFKSNEKLDYLYHNNSSDYKLNKVKSISPRQVFSNDKHKINFYSKFFIKKRLLNSKSSYSSYTNKKANLNSLKIYNNNNNFIDFNFYNSFNKTCTSINNNELLSTSTKNKKNYSNGVIYVLSNEKDEKNKDRKTVEVMERLKDNKIKNYYDRKKYFYSQRIDDYKSKDQNNNLINILTEDKPIENFSLNYNFNSNSIIGNEPTKFNKYNNFHCNSCNKIKDGLQVKKLKVRKNVIKKGMYGIKSNIFFKDIVIKDKGNNIISVKNSLKIKEKQNVYQKNVIKNNNHASFHKKNNSALLINNFDYRNQVSVIKDKHNLENRIISEINVNNNQNIESYKIESYETGVFDLSCLTIKSLDKIKEKLNNVFKTKKINFNNNKNNKYICSKLGKFFEIDIYTFNNFLLLNNGLKIKNNKMDTNSKNKNLLCYLSIHVKKLEYKKYVSNILKEIGI